MMEINDPFKMLLKEMGMTEDSMQQTLSQIPFDAVYDKQTNDLVLRMWHISYFLFSHLSLKGFRKFPNWKVLSKEMTLNGLPFASV